MKGRRAPDLKTSAGSQTEVANRALWVEVIAFGFKFITS